MRNKILCQSYSQHLVFYQRRKHFISLHEQEKKVYIFPNTSKDLIQIPNGYNVCTSVDSFKIKSLKGGFQRRPELITEAGLNYKNLNFTLPRSKAVSIQIELTETALDLADKFFSHHQMLNECEDPGFQSQRSKFALDIGCGNGISMLPLVKDSHVCIGVDLNMLSLAYIRRKSGTDLSCIFPQSTLSTFTNEHTSGVVDVVRWDLRHGLPFRENLFDISISISFLQWLFYGHRSRQLATFFTSLHRVMRPGGRCVIQFYPRSPKQLSDAIYSASLQFKGAVVGDYPHIDRGRKLFLLLVK